MCGLYGQIHPKPKKFNYPAFCVMGEVNDSRGGDSCGIFIDGQVEYGVGQEDKFFANYFKKSKLLKETKECTIALGHCRKTSPGMVTGLEQAQPVVIKKEGTDEILFVMVHNGTIHNYEALAKKYIPEIDITGMSDSQVMARIFFYKGYDVLGEYNGGSVFVIVDYRQPDYPSVYFWKGVSRKSEYPINGQPEDERPLEFIEYNDSIYFSSIGRLYPAMFRGNTTLYTMYDNSLVQYVPGEGLKIVKKYDRTKLFQSKQYSTSYGSGTTSRTTGGGGTRTTTTSSSKSNDEFSSYYDGILFQTSVDNTYTRKGKKVHGKAILSTAGKFQREEGKDTRTVWFYSGIALDLERGRQYFKFLEYLRKKSGLTQEEFVKKFENPIRLLSFDKLFFKEKVLMKATGTAECEIYTGPFHMIGNSTGENYKDGARDFSNIYKDTEYSVPFTRYAKETENRETIDLPKFREECISLMS